MLDLVLYSLLAFSCALAISLTLTPIIRNQMIKRGIVDMPDERRVNKRPIPRAGGLAVVIAFFVTWYLCRFLIPNFSHGLLSSTRHFFPICSFILVVTGFLDDRKGLSPLFRLGVQITVASLMCYAGVQFKLPVAWGEWTQSYWCYFPLTIAWYIGVINAFNLIDGLDGLSSGLAIIASIGMMGVMFFSGFTTSIIFPITILVFIGSILGFLRYNYNPASIFLGDSGSLFIGFFLATTALLLGRADAFLVTMGIPILCIGIPLIDTSLAILRRSVRYILYRKEGQTSGVMTADRNHMHHRLLNYARGNQRRAVMGLYALAIMLVAIGFISLLTKSNQASFFIIGFTAFSYVIVRFMTEVELWDTGRLLARPGARIGRRTLTVPFYFSLDLLIMMVSYAVLYVILLPMLPEYSIRQHLHILLLYIVPIIVCFALTHNYDCIWGRSTRKDSFVLILSVAIGSLISHVIMVYILSEYSRPLVRFHVVWALCLPVPLLLFRLSKSIFLQLLAASENRLLKKRRPSDASIEGVLFYGAGANLRAYITLFELNVTRNNSALLGVLDDNPGLKGRVFRDLRILGPLEILEDETFLRELNISKIIITTPAIGPERVAQVKAFCERHHLKLARFEQIETTI